MARECNLPLEPLLNYSLRVRIFEWLLCAVSDLDGYEAHLSCIRFVFAEASGHFLEISQPQATIYKAQGHKPIRGICKTTDPGEAEDLMP